MKKEALERLPLPVIAAQLKGKIRSDINVGRTEFRNLRRDLEDSMEGEGTSIEEKLTRYSDVLSRMDALRQAHQKTVLEQSFEILKNQYGQNHVFFFYQREFLPVPKVLENLTDQDNFELWPYLSTLEHRRRDIGFDIDKVTQTFADSSISIHFLYLTKTPAQVMRMNQMAPTGMVQREQSSDFFRMFNEMALSTGGFTGSSINADAAFKNAVSASENYYLVYYTPKDYKIDGQFKSIEVKVRDGNYRISHRRGYFAN